MVKSADSKWRGIAARVITLLHACFQHLRVTLRERSRQGSSRRMVLVESLSLGNRRQLFLISCDDHCFLVGAGADRVATVVAMPESTPHAAPFHAADEQVPAVRVPASHQQSRWMRDRSAQAGGLQLVRRDDARRIETNEESRSEAGRTQWS